MKRILFSFLLLFIIAMPCQADYGPGQTAENTWVDTDEFDTNLSYDDDTVQKALETLDELSGGASPLTTKGDIWGFSTVDARVPVGTNGFALVADSTQPLGVKWVSVGGTGDMLVATYDAAGIAEQLVGLTATQILTNKTITGTFTGSLTGQASTVATIAGLAPNTATTQAVQASITTAVNLSITASQVSDFDTEVANNSAVTLNTGKDTNVSTNLSEGTSTTTTVDVNSSDGTNATLVSASTSRAGLLTKAKFDEIVVNTAKVIPTDFDPAGTDNSDDNATNTLYSGLVTESTTVSAPLVKTTYALSIPKATTSVDGYLSQTDWDTFNNKISSQWTTATDDIYFSTGNVGIGTIAPSQKLDIAGNININTNGTDMLISSYHGANSDGNNSFIGGGGQNSIGEVGNTYKGSYNTAQGAYALRYNTTGYYNSAQGAYALYSNTTGNSNSAQGLYALLSNTTGNSNSAQGYAALRYNTTGSNNSAQGYAALRYNTTGYYNSAQGAYALYSNTTGNSNSAQGLYALFYNTTGNSNSAQGLYALYSNTTGYNNSAQGYNALRSNTTGYNNSAQGYNAGRTIIDGNSNTFIGYIAGYHASQKTNAVNSMALGNGAYTTADNQVVIGNTSVTQTLLNGNVGIGTTAPSGKLDIEGGDVFIGSGTLTNGSGSEDLSVTGNVEVDGIIVADGSITAGGSVILDGTIDIGTVETFVDEDATPDVSTGGYYNTNTTTTSITDFDGTNIADGQIIVVISKGAITYDVTSSGIVGGTTDIVTATGDVTNFLYDGTDWYVIARIDQSDDLN